MTNDTQGSRRDAPAPDPAGEDVGDEPLGPGGRRALEAERKARRVAEARVAELERQLADLEAAEARRAIAAERGLPAALVDRLQGTTREELEADADRLLEALSEVAGGRSGPPRKRPTPDLRGGIDPTSPAEPSPDQIAERVLRRGL